MKSDKKPIIPFSVDYILKRNDILTFVEFSLRHSLRYFYLFLIGSMLPDILLDLSVGRWISAVGLTLLVVILLFPRLQAIAAVKFLPTYKALLEGTSSHKITVTSAEIQKELSGLSGKISFDADVKYVITTSALTLLLGKTPVLYVPKRIFSHEQWTTLSDLVSSHFKPLKQSKKGAHWFILGVVISVTLACVLA